jgi:hypothetical protein
MVLRKVMKEAVRPIRTGSLSTLPHLHVQPIYRVVYPGPYSSPK